MTPRWDGKKSVAQKIVYDAFDKMSKKIPDVPVLEIFENTGRWMRRPVFVGDLEGIAEV